MSDPTGSVRSDDPEFFDKITELRRGVGHLDTYELSGTPFDLALTLRMQAEAALKAQVNDPRIRLHTMTWSI